VNVPIDTSVWSLALRRPPGRSDANVRELAALIQNGRTTIIGPIRQDLLSRVRNPRQFDLLKRSLRQFPDLPISAADYEEAAALFNQCRSRGIQGSNIDFLICAVARRRELTIFATDDDFRAFATVLPIRLHGS
jgi:predicted nucleic acid-binding protein